MNFTHYSKIVYCLMRIFWKILCQQRLINRNIFKTLTKKNVNINSIEPCDAILSATPPKHKSENPILLEIRSLKATLDSISSWKDTFEKRQQSRLPKLDTLPRRCPSCYQSNISRCVHCFYYGSPEHLLTGCLKQKQDKKK